MIIASGYMHGLFSEDNNYRLPSHAGSFPLQAPPFAIRHTLVDGPTNT